MKELLKQAKGDIKNVVIRITFALSIGISSVLGYENLNNFRGTVNNISTYIDTIIPFNKFFILPYIFWYLYVTFFLFYFAVKDSRRYYSLLIAVNTGMIICYIIYYFYPTIVVRPIVQDKDIFSILVNGIYAHDNPYNCFPSIHVFDSVLFAVYVNRYKGTSKITKLISTMVAILITLSTLFIKQHYFYDAIGGIVLAYTIYVVYNYKGVIDSIKYIIDKINIRIKKLRNKGCGDEVERIIKL